MAGPNRSLPVAGSSRHRGYKVQPPRPPNAWILYRSFKFALIRQTNERLSQAAVSKRISDMWRNETEQVKRHFERMADDKKTEHQQLYPDYRFSPQKKEEKMRANKNRKQGRAKKSKARDATPADVDADATTTMPAPPPMPFVPQPYLPPGYQPNMVLPHPYMIHYLPEAHYGPGGPSPPISAAPSPASYESSDSPEALPHPEANVASSSSSPSARPSPTSESQASSSSSQLHPNSLCFSPLPSSYELSPNLYTTQPLPVPPFQSSVSNQLPLASPRVQLPLTEDIVAPEVPVWSNIPTQLSGLDTQNSEQVVNFDIPVNQMHNFTQFPQSLCGSSSLESLQGMLSGTNENGAFDLSNLDNSDLLARPQGELEVGMGSQAPILDYNGELFTDFDFAGLQQQMASFTEGNSSSAAVTPSVQEELQTLFHTPNNPVIQAHMTAQQRQPSIFTQEMMRFLNLEAAEGSIEDTSVVSPAPLPTTVAPQQVRLQSTQHAAAMPIFTQMTNTSSAPSGTSYVPPPGAIHSSTRRVAGSWKPSFAIVPSQVDEAFQSWTFSAN